MPAKSRAQQRLFGMALAYKRGELEAKDVPKQVRALADSMTEEKLREFAATSNLPEEKTASPAGQVNRPAWIEDVDSDEYIPVGLETLLAASEKLLAINRKTADPDDRDSHEFKRLYPRHELFRERVRMDAGGVKRALARYVARVGSLKAAHPYIFDTYIDDVLIGNPLTSPNEEINMMSLVEQARRITQMGPGGIGDPNAITEAASDIHKSQFGFISPLESPECLAEGYEILCSCGWIPMEDITPEHKIRCINDSFCFPEAIHKSEYDGPLVVASTSNLLMEVTPDHRVPHIEPPNTIEKILPASEVAGRHIEIEAEFGPPFVVRPEEWSARHYKGKIFCVTVRGGLFLARRIGSARGFWTGNSERAGVDMRAAWGTRYGSDGRIYQKFFDKKKGRFVWLSPKDISGRTIKLPD